MTGRDSREIYRALFESMGSGCLLGELIRDGDGRPVDFAVHEVNAACEKLTGYRADRLAGRRVSEIAPASEPAWLRHIGRVVGHGEPLRFEEYSPSIGKWLDISACSLHRGELYAVIIGDATERRQAEEALRRSEAFLKNVFDSIQDGISVLDRDLNIVRTNHVMEEWYRHMLPLAGKKCYHAYHGRSEPCEVCPSLGAIRRGAMQCEIVPFQGENNSVKGWLEIYSFPLLEADGQVTGVIEHVRDITERKKMDEALRCSEVRFRTLFENAGAAIVIVDDRTGLIMDCNSHAEQLFGRSRGEMTGMSVVQLHPPDDREKHHREIVRQAERGNVVNYEADALRKDGRKIPVIINVSPVTVNGEKIMMGFFLDITERKSAEDALRESEEKFRAVAETASVAICILQDGRFQYVNPAMETISGYTKEELASIDFTAMIHPDALEKIKSQYGKWLAGASPEGRSELKGTSRNGEVRWADVSRKTISYRGRPAVLITGVDITERKRTEKELLEAKAQAELYLDLMGHDINNIHQVASGYLEVARDATADECQKALLARPIEALERSARLVRNVQKLQQLREGTINAQTIDLCTLLADLVREYGAMSGSAISLALNGHRGCCVAANELLYDVFANLVGNAIRHSGGRASVSVSLDRRMGEDGMYYVVSVEDDGPGIPDDLKDAVFRRRLRGMTGTSGSGLGLYLVKSLVDSYRGRVWAEDRVSGDHSQGARFVVMLPVA